MPRAKKQETSKAELIRQAAKGLPKPVRPRDIIAALKDKGVEVSYAQVSSTLKAAGFRRRRRARVAKIGATSAQNGLTIEALLAAKALIEKVGSVEAAEEAIAVIKKLG